MDLIYRIGEDGQENDRKQNRARMLVSLPAREQRDS
jgi:hypothetical protein